jgi:hypothetical protein
MLMHTLVSIAVGMAVLVIWAVVADGLVRALSALAAGWLLGRGLVQLWTIWESRHD